MNCKEINILLPEFMDGKLDSRQQQEVREHMEGCPHCSRELQEMQGFLSFLGKVPEVEVPADMAEEFALMMEAAENRSKGHVRFLPTWTKIAAAVVFVAGTFLMGYLSGVYKGNSVQQQMASDLSAQKQQLLLASLRDYTGPQKIEAVYTVSNTMEVSNDLVDALVNTMNRDKNANVRLAAIMALSGMIEKDGRVKEELIRSLAIQEDPLLQISLIQVLTEKGIREARQPIENITNNEKTDAHVKAFAKDMIKAII
ncbi:MAG: zf-HC2 domain-containing protein [Marinilabiliales bacterium]|nr:zf-HC2 domain-containing protein [Marinilabiliales bacterium]